MALITVLSYQLPQLFPRPMLCTVIITLPHFLASYPKKTIYILTTVQRVLLCHGSSF